jgi:uncharacterized protein (DUF58 family)
LATSIRSLGRAAVERSPVAALNRAGLTITGAILISAALAGYVLARFVGSRTMFLLVYGVVVLVAGAWVLGRRKLAVDAARSDLPLRVREGQLVEVEVELNAKRRVSTVVLEEDLPPLLGAKVRVPIPILTPGQSVNHVYSFVPRLRGVYQVGPLVATWSDPFGLTTKRMTLIEPTEIVVHPSTELVHDRVLTREWEDPPIRPPVSKPWPTGFEFYGMRDYVPGDDPRRIVWRATARTLDPVTGTGRYLVRESEQGITDRVGLILDTDRKHHDKGEVSGTFEAAVRTVASLGTRHLRDGFAVTVEANSRRLVEALRGQRYRIRLLDELARIQPEDAELGGAIQRVISDPRRDTHLVMVTPFLSEADARRIRLLLDRGSSILIAMVLGEDFDETSLHRAATLGCNVVELRSGDPLEAVFARVIGAGGRR